MTTELRHLLPAINQLARSTQPVGLDIVGELVHLSPGRAQRVFRSLLAESPSDYHQRVRLQRAAALLRGTESRILDIAVASGFNSHEAFTRAFSRSFGRSPSAYRRMDSSWSSAAVAVCVAAQTAPCISLYGCSVDTQSPRPRKERRLMAYEIEQRTIEATPMLFQARRVELEKTGEALSQILPAVFGYAMEHGIEMTGPPFVRYVEFSPAFASLEGGVPTATRADPPPAENDVHVGELSGGKVARTVHRGPYDTLIEAYEALDRWMGEQGVTAAGPLWEVYLTDPGEVPDPKDWETEIFWPIDG